MKTNNIIAALPILILIFCTFGNAETIFFDDFESSNGWTVNPNSDDIAVTGMFERGNPEPTDHYYYTMQNGTTISGEFCLVTGASAGSHAGENDIDGGKTSIQSSEIILPSDGDITLSFQFYFAHLYNSSNHDYLKVQVINGSETETVFTETGSEDIDTAVWESYSVDLNDYRGQTIRILITACDSDSASLVETGIDDVLIEKGTFICGNGIIDPGETCNNCPEDVGACGVQGDWAYDQNSDQLYTESNVVIKGLGKKLYINDIEISGDVKGNKNGQLNISAHMGIIDFFSGAFNFAQLADVSEKIPGHGIRILNDTKVDGELWARKVTVTLDAFPDFVFSPQYSLLSLEKTEEYIKEHSRLPGMPSEKEVKENGLDIGTMQSKLLQQIEEMTLHMIKMQKRIDELEKSVAK